MLAYSFDRFNVITEFTLPSVNDLKFSPIDFDEECNYLSDDLVHNHNSKEYISNLKIYCRKSVPFICFYKEQISSYNCTVHNISTNEISLILPNFLKSRVKKRSIIALLLRGFIGLAYEGISSYLHNRRQKALHKAFIALENKVNIQQNLIIHLQDTIILYGTYNSETWKKLINTVYKTHNTTTPNKKLFASKLSSWNTLYLSKDGIGHYSTNSLLYLRMLEEKYIQMYKKFISQLHVYAKVIGILSEGYLSISPLLPS